MSFLQHFFVPIAFIITLLGCTKDTSQGKHDGEGSTVSVAILDDPQAFDPRLIRTTQSVNFAHMLFEGLTRKNRAGKIVNGIADQIELSEDGKLYTFHLRDSVWSDNSPLTAYDFEYSIKSTLSPTFPSPNASQLYVIKGAKEFKSGNITGEHLGVKVIDEHTLTIELQDPAPYFLELTSAYFFMPVSKSWAESNNDGLDTAPETIITNGPFRLAEWEQSNQLKLEKSGTYWDNDKVNIQQLIMVIVDENTALHMFDRGELDWVGSPISLIPPDAVASLRAQKKLIITPADGVHWLRVNTEHTILSNKHFRKALALAINRKSLCEHVIQGNQQPAMGVVPASFGLQNGPCFEDNDVTGAWTHFEKSLKEENISVDDLPTITLLYTQTDRNLKIVQALQQQWKKVLGITVILEAADRAVFYDRLNRQDYDIGIGSWYGDYRDPINFLDVFKYKETRTNNTRWENPSYVTLLDESVHTKSAYERMNILSRAERVLIDDMPVIPIYYPTFNHLQQNVDGVYFSPLGIIDFKYAYRTD